MPVIVVLCGGFLLAVLWMDLMFDVQVLWHRDGDVPEAVLASIAAYYRRVTTDARPLTYAVGLAMGAAMLALAAQLVFGPRLLALASLPFCGGAVGLAAVRVVPNAIRIGARVDSIAEQSRLAHGICRDHLFCLACMLTVVGFELRAALSWP